MPIIKKTDTEPGVLGIWKLTESVEELLSIFQFSKTEKEEFNKLKIDRRKKEFITTRLLLQKLTGEKPQISHEKSGKPQLKNSSYNISISHSADFVAVLVSEKNIGIDVENTQRDIKKVANRFLCKEELEHIESLTNSLTATVIYWSAKEAIFKCTNKHGIQFNNQIFIHPFKIKKEGKFAGSLDRNRHYKLWYFFVENNVIVYCVE